MASKQSQVPFPLRPSLTSPLVTIADLDGTVYSFSNINAHFISAVSAWSGLPDWIEDRNGNKVTFVDHGNGSFSVTDTLARTALSSSGFGTTGNTVSVSGLPSPYTMTWGSSGSHWSFGGELTHDGGDGTCVMSELWVRPIHKRDAQGIHGTLYYDYKEKAKYLPESRREIDRHGLNEAERALYEKLRNKEPGTHSST